MCVRCLSARTTAGRCARWRRRFWARRASSPAPAAATADSTNVSPTPGHYYRRLRPRQSAADARHSTFSSWYCPVAQHPTSQIYEHVRACNLGFPCTWLRSLATRTERRLPPPPPLPSPPPPRLQRRSLPVDRDECVHLVALKLAD